MKNKWGNLQGVSVGIIGGTGRIGTAMGKQWLLQNVLQPNQLWIANRTKTSSYYDAWPKVLVTQNVEEVGAHCNILILSVRPAQFPALKLHLKNQLIISVMAGITIKQIETQTGARSIIRAMPNSALERGQSYTPWFANASVDQEALAITQQLFEAFGAADRITSEKRN